MNKLLERFYIKKWSKYPQGFLDRHCARYAWAVKQIEYNSKVLDICCGTGYGTAFLRYGCKYIEGIDIDQNAIKYAQNNYKIPSLVFNVLDFEKFRVTKKRENIFDAITIIEGIEHFNDPKKVLNKIAKILKPSGKLLLTTVEGVRDESLVHTDHKYEYNKREVVDLLKQYFQKLYLYDNPEIFGITKFKDREFILIKTQYPRKDRL